MQSIFILLNDLKDAFKFLALLYYKPGVVLMQHFKS